MILSIKPKTIELFPGTVAVNRLDINTDNWSKDAAGVRVSFTLLAVEVRDWVERAQVPASTTDADGEEATTVEVIDVVTKRDHVAYYQQLFTQLTQDQWDNWPAGDKDSDDNYIASCVIKNIGVEVA